LRLRRAQQHLTSRARSGAVTFVLFDLLAVAGRDLRGLPYRTRRKRLRRLLASAAAPLALMPAARDLAGAQAWMRDHTRRAWKAWWSSTANTANGHGGGRGGRFAPAPQRTRSRAA
jgi:hypothetical protein